ncbi:phosphatidate cytidylyltransferase [Thalassovita taeanensis]|uniref:Phosphatidate cytidylyltransferase n=1 Tax=Thalassovita taeanensis TaxID=657014 RepID=A0A1H8ZIF9_9RHOB|nr:phosphatidate cytidylyltransferase [Thalassovita taeanensis]SEP64115.1 phosphatidate cytidylyltransferase [Thalassovita taeanensis]
MTAPSKWDDLRPRVLSAVALVAIGGAGIWLGGTAFLLMISVLCGVMLWELMRMLAPETPSSALSVGLLGAVVVAAVAYVPVSAILPMVLAVALVGMGWAGTNKLIWLAYAPVILLSGVSALILRENHGLFWVLWLVLVVIASDVAGYFAGRMIGGPKFWPRVSPKKTWSGTIAGWGGAALVGAWFMANSAAGPGLIAVSVGMALAAQLGDIAESAIKRHAGVKDSSALIPGHGGFLDRFDAMLGALLLALFAGLLMGFPPGAV